MSKIEIKLPELGEGIEEGELVQWLVQVGDKVEPDQTIAEIMTDKANIEIPITSGGIVKEIFSNKGDIIRVGSVMLTLETEGSFVKKEKEPRPIEVGKPTAIAEHRQELPPTDSNVLASPATRKLAREIGVDINKIKGSGPAGRITREDVTRPAGDRDESRLASKADDKVVEGEERLQLRGVRRIMAEKMQQSNAAVAAYTIMDEANVSELVLLREEVRKIGEKDGIKVTYLPFMIKALVASLVEYPDLNASIDMAAQEIVYKKYYNVGIAMDTPQGLLVPVIKQADQKSILTLSQELAEVGQRARVGHLKPDEFKGATISITNIGALGGWYGTPIIDLPQVAILGMFRIYDKPHWNGTSWDVQKFMNLTVTADHRLIDGATATRFLRSFVEKIEHPSSLVLERV
jgi:pyruvate dehydrogenase E2 component (dihydrolipoamide acetyltransferase)